MLGFCSVFFFFFFLDLRRVLYSYSRILGFGHIGSLDEPRQARPCGIFKDEGLHEVVAVVSVDEVVEDGVKTAVEQRQALGEM